VPSERTTGGSPGDDDPELDGLRRRRLQEMMTDMAGKAEGAKDWPSEPFEVGDENIDEMTTKYPAMIVDCWAEWCGPCRMLAPTIHELAKEYQGKVAFGKLNTDFNLKTPRKYGIMSIPTMLFFKDGKVAGKLVGAMPKQYIIEAIDKTFSDGK
jgi:thioredoxin 1